ncbi:MAG: DNA polymerase III subunit gamma/tau, partial [Aquabacterium sp.]
HAYLFTGTRGVGKTTVSRILAKSLNCMGPDGQGGVTAKPCGVCQACRDIDAGRFVDYVELDAASNRGVDEISQLLDQAVYKPVVGRFKVYMIDEVHMLSNTAFNAMLKTLEEPPEYLKFVLATTDPQKVPVTVLSRCLQFNLRPMAAQTVFEHLGRVLSEEGIEAEPGALRLLSRAARGSMRDALSLTDQAIAFGAGHLSEPGVRQMLGSVDRQHVQRIIEAVAACDGRALVQAVDALRHMGLSASGTLEELAAALQRMAVSQAVPDAAEAADAADPDAATWRALAPLLAPDETQLFYSLCLQGRAELALAPDEYSGLLMLLLRLLAFKPGQADAGGHVYPKASGSAAQPDAAEPIQAAAPRAASIGAQPAAHAEEGRAAGAPGGDMAARTAAPQATRLPAEAPSNAGHDPAPQPVQSVQPMQSAHRALSAERAGEVPPPAERASVTPPASKPGDDPAGREAGPRGDSTGAVPPWEALPPEADGWSEEEGAAMPEEPAWLDAPDAAAEVPASSSPERRQGQAPTAPPSLALPERGADPLSDRWADVVGAMAAQGLVSALVRELAMQAQCVAWTQQPDGITCGLQVERESLITTALQDRLSQALTQHLNAHVVLEVRRGPAFNTPAQRDQAAREQRQRDAEALIHNDPLVRALLQQHPGARIVPGSIRPL